MLTVIGLCSLAVAALGHAELLTVRDDREFYFVLLAIACALFNGDEFKRIA